MVLRALRPGLWEARAGDEPPTSLVLDGMAEDEYRAVLKFAGEAVGHDVPSALAMAARAAAFHSRKACWSALSPWAR